MALGGQLREARMRLGLTTSEIAATTRMKIQLVEAIEREDFSSIAAPIYGKGFIKLFAERVGIPAAPLVEEYVEVFVNKRKPLIKDEAVSAPEEPAAEEKADSPEDDLFSRTEDQPDRIDTPAAPAERKRAPLSEIGPAFVSAGRGCVSLLKKAVTGISDSIPDLRMDLKKIRIGEAPLKTVAIAAGIVIILIFIFSALSRYVSNPGSDSNGSNSDLQLAIDPSDPYME